MKINTKVKSYGVDISVDMTEDTILNNSQEELRDKIENYLNAVDDLAFILDDLELKDDVRNKLRIIIEQLR